METLKTQANEIKNETRKGANTAVRVGGFLRDLLDRLTELFAGKVDAVPGKQLSTEDYTTEEKEKLANLDTAITEKIAEVVADAPEDFDTLKEISDWITDHADSAAAMNTAIQNKVDKETGKGLSSNDFSDEYKSQLDNLDNRGYAQTMYVEGILDSDMSINLDFNSIPGQPFLTRGTEFTVKMPSGLTSSSGLILWIKAGGNTQYQQTVAYRNGAAVPANEFIAGGTYRFVSTGNKDTSNRPIFSLTSDAIEDANDKVEQATTTNSSWRNVLLSFPSGDGNASLSNATGKTYMSDDVKVSPGLHTLRATRIQQGDHQVLDKGMVDTTLSSTSENPVQNKVVEAKIGGVRTDALRELDGVSLTMQPQNKYEVVRYTGTSNVLTIQGYYRGAMGDPGRVSYVLLINGTKNDITILFERANLVKVCQADDILLPAGKAIEISACYALFDKINSGTNTNWAVITCSNILTVNF